MTSRNLRRCGYLVATVLFIALGQSSYSRDSVSHPGAVWPAFQGPAHSELKPQQLPLEWSPDKNVAWKAAIPGYGQSSPIVWQSHVYVTSISGKQKEKCHVTAFDLETGKVVWQHESPASTQIENSNYVSKAAPTPVADQDGVVVFFESGNLLAFDHEGKVRWTRDFVVDYGEISSRHGLGSSLVQNEQSVFVWIERQTDPYVLAVGKADGKTVWKSAGLGATSWSTPALLTVAGNQHLVLSGGGLLAGYDPKTGKRLWSHEGLTGNSTPSPQACGDGCLLLGATVARGEMSSGKASDSNALVRVQEDGPGGFKLDFTWKSKRATSSFGSPVLHDGLAYFVNGTGVLFCIDAKTGEEVYSERIGDSIWATPLAVGDRIYFPGKSGTTTVIAAGREFRVLAQNRLWAETPAAEKEEASKGQEKGKGRGEASSSQTTQYAIAAVPGNLLIRTGDTLFCIK